MIDWKPILTNWSRDLMASDLAKKVETAPSSPDWLGFDPATAVDIAATESRLGLALPPSYKHFLGTTDGWRVTTTFIHRIRPVAEIDWFRVENEDWVEIYQESGSDKADKEYYVYAGGSGHDHRAEHMASLIQISDVDDGVYLLNPQAVTPDGEWEAWFFANWIPGARRYPSFAHLMLDEYVSFRRLEKIREPQIELPKLAIPGPEVRRVEKRRGDV